jgi:nucleoid-associated protein YgaU
MGIFQGSRYEYSTIDFVSITDDGDANAVVFYEFEDLGTFSYVEHTYVQGERMDTIANRYYRRPDLWWIILDFNPEISDANNIKPGTVLRIPRV